MLSVLVCSINPGLLEQLKTNLQATITMPYELLVWDNRFQAKGICAVYNDLATQARFDILCFLHEDVVFKDAKWADELIAIFSLSDKTGVVGIAGSKYKGRSYSGWYSNLSFLDVYNISHKNHISEFRMFNSPGIDMRHEVVCIDGVFMACRKNIWNAVRFNDKQLRGFHLYDIDFSLRASRICAVMVSLNIELIHLTNGGSYGDNWVNETIDFHQRMDKDLPLSLVNDDPEEIELHLKKLWLDRLKNESISFSNRIRWIWNQSLHLRFSLWYSICKFIVYKPFRLHKLHESLKK